eukprot:757041-Hanusia_phi.AAC.2
MSSVTNFVGSQCRGFTPLRSGVVCTTPPTNPTPGNLVVAQAFFNVPLLRGRGGVEKRVGVVAGQEIISLAFHSVTEPGPTARAGPGARPPSGPRWHWPRRPGEHSTRPGQVRSD